MDTITIIDGCVLLPDRHDWSGGGPRWKLSWTTHEDAALRGNEGRSGLRRYPRPTLSFESWPEDLQSATRHQARIRRGMALGGRFCCPHHGRESWLAANAAAGAAHLALRPSAWPWAVGAWLMLRDTAGQNVSTHQVTVVGGGGLNVTPALPFAYGADTPVYPLFFGRRTATDSDEVWSPDLPIARLELVGDSFVIDPALVPACCVVPDLADIDFAVLHFSWLSAAGDDLDINISVVDPVVPGAVGYGSSAGLQVPTYPAAPFLLWGRESNVDLFEEVLIDFQVLTAAYPAASQFKILLRAHWFGPQGDGHIAMQVLAWQGGVMIGGPMSGPTVFTFGNSGGSARPLLSRTFTVLKPAPVDPVHNELGTLVYTVATKSAVLLPP